MISDPRFQGYDEPLKKRTDEIRADLESRVMGSQSRIMVHGMGSLPVLKDSIAPMSPCQN